MAKKKKPPKRSASSKSSNVVTRKTKPDPIDTQEIATANSAFHVSADRFFAMMGYNPDDLVARKGLKIYKKMRRDEQIKGALTAKKYAAISTGWEVVPPTFDEGEGSEEIAEEMKEFIEFNFAEMKGTVEQKLLEMMTALDFGYSVTEPVYKLIEYGKFQGMDGLNVIKTRDPEYIDFLTDPYGNLLPEGVVQNGDKLPTDRFAIYTYRSEFDNPYGQSDLREAYRPWWLKDVLLKFMSMALERYGEPVAVATTTRKMSVAQEQKLQAAFKNLQSRTLIIVPDFIEIDFKMPPQRAGEAYAVIMDKLDTWIRVAILMPGLIGLSAEQQTGSYARAVKEFDVFLWVVGQLRQELAAVINDRIVKPLCDLNYEVNNGKYPAFKFKEVTEEIKSRMYDQFVKGLSSGAVTKVSEDENRLRDLIGFEPLTEEELEQIEKEKEEAKKAEEEAAKAAAGNNGNGNGKAGFFEKEFALSGEHREVRQQLIEYIKTHRQQIKECGLGARFDGQKLILTLDPPAQKAA